MKKLFYFAKCTIRVLLHAGDFEMINIQDKIINLSHLSSLVQPNSSTLISGSFDPFSYKHFDFLRFASKIEYTNHSFLIWLW